MEVEDSLDEYDTEEELAEEFSPPKGIIGRTKRVAGRAVETAKEKAKKEADYRAYKHQDLAYIASGKRPEKSAEFDARLAAERQAAAERREKAVAVRAQRRATIKATARAKVAEWKKQKKAKPVTRGDDQIFGGIGGSGFDLGLGSSKGFDPIGFGGGKGFDPIGFGKPGKNKKKFSLF